MVNNSDIKIAVFASGNGSNAENIIRYFKEKDSVSVVLVVSNNPNAYVLERAKKLKVDQKVIVRTDFKDSFSFINYLKENKIEWIVLAGFLWLIPADLVNAYPNRIINIHPALLPNYGGKGMFGENVHRAVSESGDTVTGISIHFVNAAYDEGNIIFKKTVEIEAGENPESIAEKVHALEYAYFPKIIEEVISSLSH